MKSSKTKMSLIIVNKKRGIISPSLFTNKFGRRTIFGKLIDKTKKNLHNPKTRQKTIYGLITIIATFVAIPAIFFMSVNALSSTLQSDWSGGVVDTPPGTPVTINQLAPETTNKYSAIDNLDATTPNKLLLGSTMNSANWCDITDVCDSTFKYRKLITITNPDSEKTDANIELTVEYDSLMKSDYSDIRFVTTDGDALVYYINQTNEESALITISFPTLPTGTTNIYMYYGKTGEIITTASDLGKYIIKSIYATGQSTCSLTFDNTVYCWGSNSEGQLGNGTNDNSNVPVAVKADSVSDALYGKVVKSINTTSGSVCAIAGLDGNSSEDKAYCWGSNSEGQLGDGTNDRSNVPVAVKADSVSDALYGKVVKSINTEGSFSCAIAGNEGNSIADKAYCWGFNENGQLGNNSTLDSNVPVAVKADSVSDAIYGKVVKSINLGYENACVIAGNNGNNMADKAYCWGTNMSGQLGNDSQFTIRSVPTAVSADSVSDALYGKVVKSISIKSSSDDSGYACAIAGNYENSVADKVYCWGSNYYGQLGDGTDRNTKNNSSVPVLVRANYGDALYGKVVKSISINSNNTCAIAGDDGDNMTDKAYCWGSNDLGQLGDGTNDNSSLPVEISILSLTNRQVLFNIKQYSNGTTGSLTSTVFHFDEAGFYFGDGILTIGSNNSGDIKIQIRTSSNADMSEASDWNLCNLLSDGDKISDSNCVFSGQSYVQYRLFMSDDISLDLETTSISFGYGLDTDEPGDISSISIKQSANGSVVSNGLWTNTLGNWTYNGTEGNGWLGNINIYDPDIKDPLSKKPYVTWPIAADTNGSGIGGYCLYFGTSADTPVFNQSAGLLDDEASPVNTNGICKYAVSENHVDFDGMFVNDLSSYGHLYFSVVAFDRALNINDSPILVSYRVDSEWPEVNTLFNGPSGIVKSKAINFSWIVDPTIGAGLFDGVSGIAGLKYCVYDMFVGADRCNDSGNWSGPGNEEGLISGGLDNIDDVFPGGSMYTNFTTNPLDPNISNNGINGFLIALVDKAGNITLATDLNGGTASFLIVVSQQAPSEPTSLEVAPKTASSNNYSFSWEPPETFEGSVNNISYCYSINVLIDDTASNCTWTAKGQLELPEGPYATKQDKNTLYLIAKNEAGNFNSDNYESVDFFTDTTAPGIPSNVEIMDASTKPTTPGGTGSWKLALTWEAPVFGSNTIASYRILRSTDGINYSSEDEPTGRTTSTNLSYIDSGLQQGVIYYYKIVACDKASKCSVRSSSVSKAPTGHYTEPATLTIASEVTDIGTKKATISWYTDRITDNTSVLFGTQSGEANYFPDGFGNQVKSTKHSVSLTNLQPGTKYYYTANWTDEGGTGKEEEKTFTTLPAPSISEVLVDHISIIGGTINLTVENASKLIIYYGQTESFGGAKAINTSSEKSTYSIELSDLQDGTKYFFKLNGFDADNNEYQGNIYSFTTLPRPKISNLRFQPVADASSNTTKVTWTTNVPASSELSYGIVGGSQTEVIESKLVTEHEITITGLEDDKDYSLIARSRDASGNLAVSDTQTFRTALDTRPPKISNINVDTSIKGSGSEARGQIVVSWTTDEPATSQVAYGQSAPGNYGNKSSEDSRLSMEHVVIVSDLSTSSIYQIQPLSKDKANNYAYGTNQSAIIGRGSEDVFTIIFNSLRKIFGIKG